MQPDNPNTNYNKPVSSGQPPEEPSLQAPDATRPSMPVSESSGMSNPVSVAPIGAVSSDGGSKKWLVPVVGGLLVAGVLGAAYVFGYYLPNKPEAVFSKSLVNSGVAVDKLVDYSNKQVNAKQQTADLKGSLNVKSDQGTVEATISGSFDDKKGDVTIDANAMGQKFKTQFLVDDVDTSSSPDVYLKVTGLKSFLEGQGMTQYASLDGQWIAIDHTIIDSYQKQLQKNSGVSAGSTTPSPEAISDAMKKVQEVNKQYLFTSDKDKSVIVNKKFVGSVNENGRSLNEYEATYNKANLEAYVDALGKALDSSKLSDWSKSNNDGKSVSESMDLKNLKEQIEKSKGEGTFKLFVDKKQKVIQKVVFTNKENKDETFSISQNYNGGDSYPLELKYVSGSGSSKMVGVLGLTIDTKANTSKITLKGNGSGAEIDAKFDFTPSSKEVKITPPASAKPITEVVQTIQGGSSATQATPIR